MINRKDWEPELRNGVCLNGCLPMDERAATVQGKLVESAVAIDYDWQFKTNMKIVKWDDSFESWLDERIELYDAYTDNGICLLPWRILDCMPEADKASNRLYWSQGEIGSCMSHANTFAFQNSTLIEIALGTPLKYHSFNPIVPFWLSKGKSLNGGQTVAEMSDWTNRNGMYCEEWVGTDNQSIPSNYKEYKEKAMDFQNGLCFLEESDAERIAEQIIRTCHAGLAWSFGNSHAVSGSKIDKNGVKVATLGGSWAHATSFSSYRKVGTTEYVFWQNSHGKIYDQSDEGEPADGAWMPLDTLCRFCRSIYDYGYPYVHFVEGEITDRKQLNPAFKPTFPANWIR